MKNPVLSVLVGAMVLLSPPAAPGKDRHRSVRCFHGTLVEFMPTGDGLIIMADRFAQNSISGDIRQVDKLMKLDNYTAVASTGLGCATDQRGKVIYDAVQIAHYAWVASADLGESLRPRVQRVEEALLLALSDIPRDVLQSRSDAESQGIRRPVVSLMIMHWDRAAKKFETLVVEFFCDEKTSNITSNSGIWTDANLATTKIEAVGTLDCYDLIAQGKDAGLSPGVASRLRSQIVGTHMAPLKSTTQSQAIELLASLTCSTAQLTKKVGRVVDVAKISPKSGFSWIYRRADATKLALQK